MQCSPSSGRRLLRTAWSSSSYTGRWPACPGNPDKLVLGWSHHQARELPLLNVSCPGYTPCLRWHLGWLCQALLAGPEALANFLCSSHDGCPSLCHRYVCILESPALSLASLARFTLGQWFLQICFAYAQNLFCKIIQIATWHLGIFIVSLNRWEEYKHIWSFNCSQQNPNAMFHSCYCQLLNYKYNYFSHDIFCFVFGFLVF